MWPSSAEFGPSSDQFARSCPRWAKLDTCWPVSTDFGQTRPTSGRTTWPNSGQNWSTSSCKIGGFRPISGRPWSIPVRFWSILADVGQKSMEFGPKSVELGQIWPTPSQIGRHWPKLCQIWGHVRTSFGQSIAASTGVGPIWANIGENLHGPRSGMLIEQHSGFLCHTLPPNARAGAKSARTPPPPPREPG